MSKHVACRDAGIDCDFEITDENEDELVDLVQQHGKNTHDTEYSREDVMGLAKEV